MQPDMNVDAAVTARSACPVGPSWAEASDEDIAEGSQLNAEQTIH